MENHPRTIISYSREHTDLKDFFVSVLEDMGFTCELIEDTPDSSTEASEQSIKSADCFIGLLTPDQHNKEGHLTCSDATVAHIGMAYNNQKPIQLFAFDAVDVSGIVFPLTTNIAKIQLFKTKFGKSIIFDAHNARQIFKAMLEFKQQIIAKPVKVKA
jgi:hypothetical protein